MPEGSIGKEGPSAGIAIMTAFVSLFSKQGISSELGWAYRVRKRCPAWRRARRKPSWWRYPPTAPPSRSITGKLGDVIKESAQIALAFLRAHAFELGLTDDKDMDWGEEGKTRQWTSYGRSVREGI
jgi:hypothetical protein